MAQSSGIAVGVALAAFPSEAAAEAHGMEVLARELRARNAPPLADPNLQVGRDDAAGMLWLTYSSASARDLPVVVRVVEAGSLPTGL